MEPIIRKIYLTSPPPAAETGFCGAPIALTRSSRLVHSMIRTKQIPNIMGPVEALARDRIVLLVSPSKPLTNTWTI